MCERTVFPPKVMLATLLSAVCQRHISLVSRVFPFPIASLIGQVKASLLCSMKEELRELHAQHETDAGDILEWKATSKDLERQCLQQQAEISGLKNELASLRKTDVKVDCPSKQQAQGHRYSPLSCH